MKGFTLVELIVVIAILSLMALVAFPAVYKVINDSREDAYQSQTKVIEKAAKEWGIDHLASLPESGCIEVKVQTLVNNGYISTGTPKNPRNNQNMDGFVKITLVNNKYNYEYKTTSTTGCTSY